MNQNGKLIKQYMEEETDTEEVEKEEKDNVLKRVSRYQINHTHPLFLFCDEKCFFGKNLRNLANYWVRRFFIYHNRPEEMIPQEVKDEILLFNGYIKEYNKKALYEFKVKKVKKLKKLLEEERTFKQQNNIKEFNKTKKKFKKELKKNFNPQSLITNENGLLYYNFLNYYFVHCLNTEDNPYRTLPAQASQQVLRGLTGDWKTTFKSLKAYYKNPSKFTGKPNIPKYKKKDGRLTVCLTNQQCKVKNGYLTFPKSDLTLKIGFNCSDLKLKQVRIVPMGTVYTMELVWEKPKQNPLPNIQKERCIAIDLGVSNLATITNNIGLSPIIINGRKLKYINHCYNKTVAALKSKLPFIKDENGNIVTNTIGIPKQRTWSDLLSRITKNRNNIMDVYMHKISKYIVEYCKDNQIGTIVIGLNDQWKQNVNMDTRNNQNFVSIPFRKLINKIIYKAEELGIQVIVREESYTSKASFLDLDDIPTYKKGNETKYTFSGKRVKRGLYKSKNGTYINADVNGSYNIMRKEFPQIFTKENLKNFLTKPKKVNII